MMDRREWLRGAVVGALALPMAKATTEAAPLVRLADGRDLALVGGLELAERDGRLTLPSAQFRVRAAHLFLEGEDVSGPRAFRSQHPLRGNVVLGPGDALNLQWRLSMPGAPLIEDVTWLPAGEPFGMSWGGPG